LEHAGAFWTDFSEDSGFLGPRLSGIFLSKPKVSQLLSRFISSKVSPTFSVMTFAKMFFWRDTLKVLYSVVGFNSIDVVDMFGQVKIVQPTSRHNTVHKALPSQYQISLRMLGRGAELHLPKNFATARYGVKMVKHAVFNAVHRKANHVEVPFFHFATLPLTERNVQ